MAWTMPKGGMANVLTHDIYIAWKYRPTNKVAGVMIHSNGTYCIVKIGVYL